MATALKPSKPFDPKKTREISVPGMNVPVFEQGGWLWWKLPPVEETKTWSLTAKASPYGTLPRTCVALDKDTWMTPDTCVPAGRLNDTARKAFQSHKTRSVFLAHNAGSGEYYCAPADQKTVLPAINAILLTDRANVPPEILHILWPLMWTSIRTGSAEVAPGRGGRAVEQTDMSKRPPPDIWHNHRNGTGKPDWKTQIQIPRNDYVLSDAVPTAIAGGRMKAATPAEFRKAAESGFVRPHEKAKDALLQPASLMPFTVGVMTNDSWHSSQQNILENAVHRHFMRVFTGVETRVLTKHIRENPQDAVLLRRHLRHRAPDELKISVELV